MPLSKGQKEELNKAIYEYLSKQNYASSAEVFATEAELSPEDMVA